MMVHVDANSNSVKRTRLALEFANYLDATLIGISASELPLALVKGAIIEAKDEYETFRQILEKREAEFRSETKQSRKPVGWRVAMESPTNFMERQSRAADLLIVGPGRDSEYFSQSIDVASLVMRAGRPVLTVPDGVSLLDFGTIIIAWKDSREARRAVQDSLPLLHEAKNVHVVEIDEVGAGEDLQSARDVAHYLTQHRIKASAEVIQRAGNTVCDDLLGYAASHQAGLLVAGAYGHTRLGEWMFGGVTRDLLKKSPLCCLLSN